ncbi:MAG TPA: hypothetical protein VIV40_31185 [Kofleriaceae bacterium]
MKTSGLILGALVAGGVAFTIKGGCLSSEKPADAKLAAHFDKLMCGIARNNIKTPERGVRELGRYMDKHTGEMLGDFGEMIATIERIKDDDKHDRRAEKARDRLHKPLIACARDWNRFGEAISEDPKAMELLERFNERLSRTFEIIFGADGFDLMQLPKQLEQSLTQFAPR